MITEISVNMEYLVKSIEERIEKDLILRELHGSINDYCIEVTGRNEEHIIFEDVERMFKNIDLVNLTIDYAFKCLDGINEKEKAYILKITSLLNSLKVHYENCIPF